MSDAEYLEKMGTNGATWALEFQKQLPATVTPIDAGMVIGWFANAIEAGRAAGRTERTNVNNIPYRYGELGVLNEIREYIDSTYSGHYVSKGGQTMDRIFDNGHGLGYSVGCMMKYTDRFGKKAGYNRQDILKMIHYAIFALHAMDLDDMKALENSMITKQQVTVAHGPIEAQTYVGGEPVAGGQMTGVFMNVDTATATLKEPNV